FGSVCCQTFTNDFLSPFGFSHPNTHAYRLLIFKELDRLQGFWLFNQPLDAALFAASSAKNAIMSWF
ncbi:hypothetical protein, partial [Aquabacterium sp.]|uniref:hypothetical protein n=1 Tax=Aquabacterium sp. TaxID=1872578 RepID=UPI003D6D400F